MKKKDSLFSKFSKTKEARKREPDKIFILSLLIFFNFFLFVHKNHAQYSNTHYVPPYVSGVQASNTQNEQYLVLTTLESAAFDVTITLGDGTTKLPTGQLAAGAGTSIITSGSPSPGQYNSTTGVASISATNPLVIRIGVRSSDSVAGTGVLTTNDINTSTGDLNASVTPGYEDPSNQGLILTASNNFYVNLRHDSGSQGGSLTGKGSAGLGQSFITGSPVANNTYDQNVLFISVMATQPGTTNVTFTDFNGRTFIGHGTSTTINKSLSQGETYVIAQVVDGDGSDADYDTAAERNSFNGISVTSDKDIAIASGGLAGPDASSAGRDIGYDQLVPVSEAGSDFILVRGQGSAALEYAIVVATQANTQVFLNGSGTAVTTLANVGDYILLNSTNSLWQTATSSNDNAYIRTDKPSFVYQTTNGANASNVSSMNLIPPISLCSEVSEVTIANPLQFGTAYLNITVPVGTNTTVTPTGGGTTFVIGPDGGDDVDNSSNNVTGNTEWFTHTYQIPSGVTSINIKGNGDESVGATNPINVGFLGASGNKGAAGYFAGFGAPPSATVDGSSIMLGGIASTTLNEPLNAAGETAVSFSFEVEVQGDCTSNVSVDWEVIAGTAQLGTDYTLASGTTSGTASFTAPSGTSTQTISLPNITIKDDAEVEPTETLIIRLSNPVNAVLGNTDTEISITDNDTSVSIAATDATKSEGNSGNTAFTFTVTRTGITTGTSSVDYAITGSGANAADATDFGGALPSGTVNFAATETSKVITVNVNGDSAFEQTEEFTVTLSNPTGTEIGTATATGSITNDDSGVSVSSPTITEGDSGTTNADVVVTLSSPAPSGGTTIYYTVVPGTAVAGVDYTAPAANARIIIPAGSSTGTISIPIIGDTTIEADKSFTVQVTRDLIINAGFQDGTTGWTTVSGTPNCAGSFSFEVNAETVYGGSVASNQVLEVDCLSQGYQDFPTKVGTTYDVSFITSRRTAGGSPASVNGTITVQDNNGGVLTNLNSTTVTKTNTTFEYTSSTFSFTATGTTSRVLFTSTLTQTLGLILDDLSVEPQVADATSTVTITDDDTSVSIAATDAVKAEGTTGSTAFTFTVTRNGDTSGTSAVNYVVTGSGANPAAAADFGGTFPSGTVNFAAAETSKVVTINVSGDTTVEPDEGFTVTLSSPVDVGILTGTAIGTITNDDPTITFNDITVTYGDANFNLGATSNSGGTITYSIVGSPNGTSLSGTNNETVTIGDAGTVTIRATVAANGIYTSGTKDITLTIDPKALTITATDQNKEYGSSLTGGTGYTTFTSVGLANSETIGSVTVAYADGEAATDAVGTYTDAIQLSAATGGTFTASNYTISYVDGDLTVTAKALTITATDQNKEYGSSLTGGTGYTTFTSVGLANSETIGSVTVAYADGEA
ncbi:beta strand repeat-containing protein, partial [Tenacibaculum sp. Cn5-34]